MNEQEVSMPDGVTYEVTDVRFHREGSPSNTLKWIVVPRQTILRLFMGPEKYHSDVETHVKDKALIDASEGPIGGGACACRIENQPARIHIWGFGDRSVSFGAVPRVVVQTFRSALEQWLAAKFEQAEVIMDDKDEFSRDRDHRFMNWLKSVSGDSVGQ